jgi:hypothetical protein
MATPMTKTDFDNAIEEINEMAAKKILELDRIDKIVQAAVLAEREACAKLCEEQDEYGCGQYAKAIRARGEK